jgi:hypothetical protein
MDRVSPNSICGFYFPHTPRDAFLEADVFKYAIRLPAHWSLTSLREKLVKIGAKIVAHSRYVTFQMAEVAVPRDMFAEVLRLIAQLRAPPATA